MDKNDEKCVLCGDPVRANDGLCDDCAEGLEEEEPTPKELGKAMKFTLICSNLFLCCAMVGCGTNPAMLPEIESVPGCSNSCFWAFDGVCDDGGTGAVYDDCNYGTDCADCGSRGRSPITCQSGSDCDDGDACTADRCVDGECYNDPFACEDTGPLLECVADWECDDSIFCNGQEMCVFGQCVAGRPPCEECDEGAQECLAPEVSTVSEILDASWLVVVVSYDGLTIIRGSAFAIGGNLLATNAHVVEDAAREFQLGGSVTVYQHETGEAFSMSAMWIHPDYTGTFSPDVGIIEIDSTLPSTLVIADDETLRGLQVFDDIRLSGFPGELGDLDLVRPRATMLSGRITAMRPFDQSVAATPETAMMIQHDMPTTGGTSGSPVVNSLGEVIAIHNSRRGMENGQSNFAIRADALSQLLEWILSGQISSMDLSPTNTAGLMTR